MKTVTNSAGIAIDFDAAVAYMDPDIRETVHYRLAPCTDQEFFDAYCAAHLEEFGEQFAPDCENAAW